ncbi:MAG TPA: hypothetical protein VIU82_26070 [Bosea sp. (in: a-proteobacteria)]
MSLQSNVRAEEAWVLEVAEAFVTAAPPITLLLIRAARAVSLFFVSAILLSVQPAALSVWGLAFVISMMTLFNITKWFSAVAIGLLLISAVMPPHVLALIAAR